MLMKSRWVFISALPSLESPGCHQLRPEGLHGLGDVGEALRIGNVAGKEGTLEPRHKAAEGVRAHGVHVCHRLKGGAVLK